MYNIIASAYPIARKFSVFLGAPSDRLRGIILIIEVTLISHANCNPHSIKVAFPLLGGGEGARITLLPPQTTSLPHMERILTQQELPPNFPIIPPLPVSTA